MRLPTDRRGRLVAAVLLCGAALGAAGCGGDDDAFPAGEEDLAGPALAVIGDTPYGSRQVARFRQDVKDINADPDVTRVIHLGDIQAGPSRCSDGYLARIRRDFDAFEDPLVYTPGDNEWTDCHVQGKGGFSPTERLESLRSVFFDRPGRTLGRRRARVKAQGAPYVENVRWTQARTVFTTIHVPGSNNGLVPWTRAPESDAAQRDEYGSRLRANLAWLDQAFEAASAQRAAAVVVAMQADMWPPHMAHVDTSGYAPIITKLAKRARAFRRPVLVLQGDSHVYRFDRPLARHDPPARNLIRIVVRGGNSGPSQWLRLDVDPDSRAVFNWENVDFD